MEEFYETKEKETCCLTFSHIPVALRLLLAEGSAIESVWNVTAVPL